MADGQITVTSAMLNRAKGTELVSHLKVRPVLRPSLVRPGEDRGLAAVGVSSRSQLPLLRSRLSLGVDTAHPYTRRSPPQPAPPPPPPPRRCRQHHCPCCTVRARQKLQEEVSEYEQTDIESGTEACFAVLSSSKLVKHRDSDVK